VLHLAKEAEVVLETLVVVLEVILVAMMILVTEETSVVEVALVVANGGDGGYASRGDGYNVFYDAVLRKQKLQ
jgi:hypothetical protein